MESAAHAAWNNFEEFDLSATLTKLNRVKAKNRARLANSELTRAFLNSALALSEFLFVEDADTVPESGPPTFDYLSRPRIVLRAQVEFPHLSPTVAKFRDRWPSHHDFLDDFIAYAMLTLQHSVQHALIAWSEALLGGGADFATAVHRVAYEGAHLILGLPAYRLRLLSVASASADHDVSDALKRMYASLADSWSDLYGRVAEVYGFTLRRGLSVQEFTIILQAVSEGLCVRLLAGLDEPLVNDETYESILGKAALALFVSLVDNGDGLTIEQAANERFSGRGGRTT
ncbi:hypothetical protein SPF06_02725 [Sinomonas sp. JGH33]|uniref:Tetracyclin repressor-like C-terminal domain-containing protein n=1 Tax=Sinomonas terricola TaxID=3110330 RepID=A0ABU5T243_9MICC|nr:hypothetical protein [Sinomonas sp. JGH33]MEA5453627.1 hypothetical protein [Sinomonas sp. JGH33]